MPDPVKTDLRRFVEMVTTQSVDPKSFGVAVTKDEGIEILNRFYALSHYEGVDALEDQEG